MSIHPSLSSSSKEKAKSVMKRAERIRSMLEKGQWKEGDKVFGLPKIKTIRIKIKKEKTAEKTAETAATVAAPAAESKEQAPAKAAAKAPEKK